MKGNVEFLAGEFKRLTGWGAAPKRLPLQENLASLAQVPENAGFVAAGFIIRRYLISAVDSLEGTKEFYGRKFDSERLIRVFRLLFQIEGTGLSAVNRRYRAIQLLGLPITMDAWRRPGGPEYQLMLVLAEHCQTSKS